MGTWQWDVGTGELVWSETSKRLLRIPADQPADYAAFLRSLHPEDREVAADAANAAIAVRGPYDVEVRIALPHGKIRWVALLGHVLCDSAGKPTNMAGVATDVTARKQAEMDARSKEHALRLFIEHAPAAIAVFDQSMRYLAVSRRWLTDYGLGDRNVIGLSHYDVFPEIPERWKEIHRRCLAGATERSEEEPFRRADGKTDWVRWEIIPWFESCGVIGGIIVFTEVVTKRKLAEDALKKAYEEVERRVKERTAELTGAYQELKTETEGRKRSEENRKRLAAATENAAEAIIITDSRFHISYTNPAFTSLSGYSTEEVVGRSMGMLRVTRKEHLDEGICVPFARDRKLDDIYPLMCRDGRVKYGRAHISAIKEPGGAAQQYVIIIDDATAQLRLEERLRQMQKMEAVGTLAGGIAHDFNNILAIILGNAELASEDVHDPGSQRNMDQIIQASKRGRELVRQILAFSRKTERSRKPVHLRELVTESCTLLRASVPSTIDIRFEGGSERDTILGDETQIRQVVVNLVTNAAQAIPHRGTITVALSLVSFGPGDVPPAAGMSPGDYVALKVEDTGTGMSDEVIGRIFEPFYTTKEAGRGSGMGLSVVYGIVRSHGGAVTVRSKPKKGSTFTVFLPLNALSDETAARGKKDLPAA